MIPGRSGLFRFPAVVLSPSIFGPEPETVHGPFGRFPNGLIGLCSSASVPGVLCRWSPLRPVFESPANSPSGLWSYRLWGTDNFVVTRKLAVKDASRQAEMKRLHGENGVELLEFALVIPIFVFVLYGLIAFGLMLSAKQTVTNAAAEGARAAVGASGDPVAAARSKVGSAMQS